jgi:hypothetical protein
MMAQMENHRTFGSCHAIAQFFLQVNIKKHNHLIFIY